MSREYEAIIKSVAKLVVMGPWDVKELLGLLIVKVSSGCFFYPRFSVLAEHAEHLRKTSLVHASLRGFQISTQKQAGRETHKNSAKTPSQYKQTNKVKHWVVKFTIRIISRTDTKQTHSTEPVQDKRKDCLLGRCKKIQK